MQRRDDTWIFIFLGLIGGGVLLYQWVTKKEEPKPGTIQLYP